jgi:hypothetical protein
MFLASTGSAAQDDRGLFDFTPVEEPFAREVLAELRLAV